MAIKFSNGTITGTDSGGSIVAGSSGTKRNKIRKYTSSGKYNPTSGTKYIEVHVIGGGGGTSSGTERGGEEQQDSRSFGGGGGGGYAIGNYTLLSNSFEAEITVGAGGAGGQASSSEFRSGSNGGFSRFETETGSSTFTTNGGASRQTGSGGEGCAAGTAGHGNGGAGEGTIEYNGSEGFDGAHGSMGGFSGAGGSYGKGGHGVRQGNSEVIGGNAGANGYVWVIEYLEE